VVRAVLAPFDMGKIRLSRLALVLSVSIVVLALIACAALKVVTDIMALRAQQLAVAAANHADAQHLMQLNAHVEGYSMFSDYVAWAVAALVLGGGTFAIAGMYRYLFRPLSALASTMKRFSEGEREARATRGPLIELATVANTFNEMADIVTGQHERMLNFLGETAQELKDPVYVMRRALREFAPDKPFPNEKLARQRLAAVSNELDRLERQADNYIDAGHVEWRRLDLQTGRQDFRKIVQQVGRLYETFSHVHRQEVLLPDRPVWVYGDPDRLAQVIHALLTNAIALSPRGGVVEICLTCEKREVTLRVTDHGVGISEKDLATIFEPFQKVSAALQNAPGASVALSVARRIVQAHRGQIEASSKVGEGSTFRVRLPLAEPVAAEVVASGHAAAPDNNHQGTAPDGRGANGQGAAPDGRASAHDGRASHP
jgi:signal transduction histidine kinase